MRDIEDSSQYAVAPPGSARPRPKASRLAVFVTHGMGQQVPFATLDDLVTALRKVPVFAKTSPRAEVVLLGDQSLQRIALHLDELNRDVHFYEGYWAPITEGVVTLRDVVRFLFGAGLNGIRNSESTFHRWAFGSLMGFDIPVRTWVYLIVAVMTVCALVSMNAVVAVVTAARAALGTPAWLGDPLLVDLTATLNLFLVMAVGFGLTLLASRLAHRARAGPTVGRILGVVSILAFVLTIATANLAGLALPSLLLIYVHGAASAAAAEGARAPFWDHLLGPGRADDLNGVIGWSLLLVVVVAVIVGLIRPWLWIFFRAIRQQLGSWARTAGRQQQPGSSLLVLATLSLLVVLLLLEAVELVRFARVSTETYHRGIRLFLTWPALLAVSAVVRFFLVQYVGDVAAYVSAHTVDRFAEVRQRIKDAVGARARAVYAAAGDAAYDGVILVGHSLGSVVTYDVLNRLINEDELHRPVNGPVYEVARRTRLLLTFGSPLDKTAFLFATQTRRMSVAREALATTTQPLIQDYAFRTMRWVNIYSPWDIISGALNYYDAPDTPVPPGIDNKADPDATTLLAAHTEYWGNRLLRRTLAAALTSP